MEQKKEKGNIMEKVATFIVDKRNLFFLLYIFAAVFCIFSMSWTQVENDVTKYLSEESETRQGLETMNKNFVTTADARVMISNITYEDAKLLYDQISVVDGVSMVTFTDSQEHYKNANALFAITFGGGTLDASSIQALDNIKELLQGYDVVYDTSVGYDENAELALSFGVKQAPTLIITDGENFEKYAGAPAIKQYLSKLA